MFQVKFADEQAWALVADQVRGVGGVMLDRGDADLQPFAQVEIRFLGPSGTVCDVSGTVVRLTESQVAFTFDDAAVNTVTAARFGPEPSEALWHRYDTLSKAEKLKLARSGGLDAVRMILRDRDASLAPLVLDNPRLEPQDIAGLLRTFKPSAVFFERLSRNARLMRNSELMESIVRHPKAPVGLAVRLVGRLPMDSVRRIARTGSARMPIVTAARKRAIPR
jgi:hypothetical protein